MSLSSEEEVIQILKSNQWPLKYGETVNVKTTSAPFSSKKLSLCIIGLAPYTLYSILTCCFLNVSRRNFFLYEVCCGYQVLRVRMSSWVAVSLLPSLILSSAILKVLYFQQNPLQDDNPFNVRLVCPSVLLK